MSSGISAVLFCIAKNQQKQENLRKYLCELLPNKNDHFTIEKMQNMPYLRACIKESLRMYPPVSGNFQKLKPMTYSATIFLTKTKTHGILSNIFLNLLFKKTRKRRNIQKIIKYVMSFGFFAEIIKFFSINSSNMLRNVT